MILNIKKIFYFPFAYYFFIFAKIQLLIWKPKVICITGSSGKTTLLHLIESQISDAHFSHHANSAYGIPFDILGIKRSTFSIFEWPKIIITAPFRAFKKPYKENLYVVEADCDRSGEGYFLSKLLKPSITLWLSSDTTHTMNFENKKNINVKKLVAYEYGFFIENTKDIIFVNADSQLIENELYRTKTPIKKIKMQSLLEFEVKEKSVSFKTLDTTYNIPCLVPRESFYSIEMTSELLKTLGKTIDKNFLKFTLPPGRSSLFRGIKNTKILDSSYNSSTISLSSMFELFNLYKTGNKWIIIGDILDLGKKDKEEHEKVALMINKYNFEKVILVGPRTQKYTYPLLKNKDNAKTYLEPLDTLKFIKQNIEGDEILLFKGARFLEGIIEHLLEERSDIRLLCRREKVWQKRREKWGL